MKQTMKVVLIATAISIAGLGGLAKIVSAQTQMPTLQHHLQMAQREASNGDGEINDDAQEQSEAERLRSLAKITPQQAQQAAEGAVGGGRRASQVRLENEDGNLVYAVTIGDQEAKVDAGNGTVLYVDAVNREQPEANRPASSIQATESPNGDGDGETNDDG